MDFQGRAFYNLLRFNALEDPASRHYEKWQVEDYRTLTDQQIFSRLHAYSCDLDLEVFQELAKNFDSPESLSEYLIPDEFEAESADKIYLCLFELWRRYKKDCRSLSIFSDELDHWMHVYDGQKEDVDDIIYSYLFELENFLDEEADQGKEPKAVFSIISYYFAHDIENFIYDFVYDLVEKESLTNASEIIDAFLPYVKREIWFEFLKLKMFSLQDLEQFPSLLHRFSEKVIEVKDIELLVEVLDLMIDSSQVDLFLSVFKEGLKLLQNAGQLEEFLFVLRDFYDSIEDHKKSMRVQEIMKSHQKKDPNKKVVKDDPILIEIKSLI
jgi:hypothetical protein